MSLIWLQVFNAPANDAFSLSIAEDLSSFGYFQRSTVREHLVFAGRTTASRCPKGSRITIKLKEVAYQCHCYRRVDGLTGIVISNNEYQERVAHSLITKLLSEFEKKFGNQWNRYKSDNALEFDKIQTLLKEYQNPEEADKMLKLQKNLDEIKDIMHKNIEEILNRGETLDTLLQKSDDIGEISKMFHKNAKKTNQCCQYI